MTDSESFDDRDVTPIRRVIRPEEVVLVIGIPTSREEFEEGRRLGSEFVRKHNSPGFRGSVEAWWLNYSYGITEPYNAVLPTLRGNGVAVYPFADLSVLEEVALAAPPVLAMLTHSTSSALEMHGRMYSHREVAAVLPVTSRMLIDALTCGSQELAGAVKERCPHVRVYVADAQLNAFLWLYALDCVITRLGSKPTSYVAAFERCSDTIEAGLSSGPPPRR